MYAIRSYYDPGAPAAGGSAFPPERIRISAGLRPGVSSSPGIRRNDAQCGIRPGYIPDADPGNRDSLRRGKAAGTGLIRHLDLTSVEPPLEQRGREVPFPRVGQNRHDRLPFEFGGPGSYNFV